MDQIIVKGARENNLKNIDIVLPKNKFIVMTGVSGSGKSSLAFDTIYAEGQRRYIESLSAYARQFLGGSEKPDVDSIEGLSPAISIDQKTTSKNPRSTVGTVTEIYDYFRLLYARIGIPYCPEHKIAISSQSIEEMTNQILKLEETKIKILGPIVNGEKGTHKDVIEKLKKDGFSRLKINNQEYEINQVPNLEKNKKHYLSVVVDRLVINSEIRSRLYESLEIAAKLGNGKVIVETSEEQIIMSEKYACPHCDFSLSSLEPNMFSFNTPHGACPDCNGLGNKLIIDPELIVKDRDLSINQGALIPLGEEDKNIYFTSLKAVSKKYNIDLDKSYKKLTKEEKDIILYGSPDQVEVKYVSKSGVRYTNDYYEGIISNLKRRYIETQSNWIREWIEQFMVEHTCETCHGARLKDSILAVLINKKNIYQLTTMSIRDIKFFLETLKLNEAEKKIANLVLKEICSRLDFLINVGLDYLTLARSAATLSGGESQRIRLATQIGSHLTGVLYVLDEPSIGLHQRDNQRLIESLKKMRDLGNTLIVIEHDIETMRASDFLVDIGPGAGDNGGEVVALGTPEEVMKVKTSITGQYLSGFKKIDVPKKRRGGNNLFIEIKGASENNLKNINIKFPLGKLIAVTGVSGSGKSSLVNQILYLGVAKNIYKIKEKAGQHKQIIGAELIDKVVDITQDPIGRTPRSNPATYTGVFDDIRDVFAATKEARSRGYLKGRFSFNVKGGRCEACTGDGVKRIEMHFLPDVYVTCEVCKGTRYNSETLEIKYKNKSIYDVLEMRVEEAIAFFENIPKVKNKLQMLYDVGLTYIKLGQSAPLLSGGEAGRVKLAKELQKKPTGKTLFILDEPTTGLHSDDIKKLLKILNRIVDNGDTVVVIEHNLDVIKVADHIIDLGPEGGDLGGYLVAEGTPEEVVKIKESYTGQFLKKELIK